MARSRSFGRTATVALLALALTACWPWPGQNPDRTAYNPGEHTITPATVARLARSWEAPLDGGVVGSPVISASRAHVVAGNSVYGIDTRTGARAWKASALYNPPGFPEFPSPATFVDRGRLLVTGAGSAFMSGWSYTLWFDPTTGALLESSQTGAGMVDALRGDRAVGNFLTRATDTPTIWYLAERAGQDSIVRRVLNVEAGESTFTIGTDRIYASGESLVPPVHSAGTPTVYDDIGPGLRAYPFGAQPTWCTTDEFSPFAIEFECPSWVAALDGTSVTQPVLAPDGSAVFVGTQGGNAYAIDPADGSVRWSASLGAPVTAAPALAGGTLFVPTGDGRIVALRGAGCGQPSCRPLWSAPTGGEPSSQPAVAGGLVFTGAATGALRAFDAAGCGAATCRALWAGELGSRVTGAPAVTGGRLYVGTEGGRLVSYALAARG
jgi:outer membrane protein assembly factor BamB